MCSQRSQSSLLRVKVYNMVTELHHQEPILIKLKLTLEDFLLWIKTEQIFLALTHWGWDKKATTLADDTFKCKFVNQDVLILINQTRQISFTYRNALNILLEVEVWEWIRNFISHFIVDVITYSCWTKWIHVGRRGPRCWVNDIKSIVFTIASLTSHLRTKLYLKNLNLRKIRRMIVSYFY